MNCRRRPASFRTRKATEAQRHGGGIEILFNCCLVVLGVSVPLWQNVNYNLRERRKQMPYKKLTIGGAKQEILSWANHDFSIEEQSMVRNVPRLPCLFKHVALMPDAHLGKGSMVGSVIATKQAVIPATVGVDIGCGMMAVKTPFKRGILDGKESVEIVGTSGSRSSLLHPGHAGIRGVLERPGVGANLRNEKSRDHDGAFVEGLQQDVQSSPAIQT